MCGQSKINLARYGGTLVIVYCKYWGMVGNAIQKYLNWTTLTNTSAAMPIAEYKLPNETDGGPSLKV